MANEAFLKALEEMEEGAQVLFPAKQLGNTVAELSIAISLKRIADILEHGIISAAVDVETMPEKDSG